MMREGAFAFIDCLGWRGIWRKIDSPDNLVTKIRMIERFLEDDVKYEKNRLLFTTVEKTATISFLSDTVVISVQAKDPSADLTEEEKGELIAALCFVVLKTISLFLAGHPPIPMRGCIVYGEHLIDGNLILGKAVDEGAEYEKLANAACVWLHPDASRKFEAFNTNYISNVLNDRIFTVKNGDGIEDLVEGKDLNEKVGKILAMSYPGAFVVPKYALPIKGGDTLECSVLNPLSLELDKAGCEKTLSWYSTSMSGNDISVLIKKQNTEKFLETAAVHFDLLTASKNLVEVPVGYKENYKIKYSR